MLHGARSSLAIQVMPLTSDFDILLRANESIGAGDKVGGMSSREF